MSLATFATMLTAARQRGYAVGSFNAWDIYSARTIISAAERLRAPVIISLWQKELDLAGEAELYGLTLSFARAASVPVAVFIDHAQSLAEIERAIALGATSVMIDGSHFPLEENIACTAQAARLAHAAGVSIEGELGRVGEEEGSTPDASWYTDPAEAECFVAETGIDALAVAIGNAHGIYRQEPKLALDVLAEIGRRVSVPLVLHGGSGIPDADLRRGISLGIAKVNIGAEGRVAFFDGLRASLTALPPTEKFPHRILPSALAAHAALVEEKMRVLMSGGRGEG